MTLHVIISIYRQESNDIPRYETLKFDQNFKLAYNKNDIYFCRRIVN